MQPESRALYFNDTKVSRFGTHEPLRLLDWKFERASVVQLDMDSPGCVARSGRQRAPRE